MEIRNRSTGAVTTVAAFKATQPNTSFPKQITTDILDSYGYDAVLNGPAATVTAPYGVSTRSGVEEKDGKWYTKFVAGPIFANADDETAYKAKVDADAAKGVRSERDAKLTECDWTQANDSPLKAASAWTTYRQALRDVPAQSGFPHTVNWPTKPS
tara:strand:+ start:199 stop:666 length:468 start_codon:yes stop_codon:yes gene_type:complete